MTVSTGERVASASGATAIPAPRSAVDPSLARLIGHQVRELDHVASASVTATSYKVSVRAASRDPADAATSGITIAVHTLLSELPLVHAPKVSVTVSETEKPA